ncbi:hypothetical protein [Atlanticothrix silvestris]|nr:hypothetical protein [Atlanticothrix silvestris]
MKAIGHHNLTAEERQSILLNISKEYMRGKISHIELQEAERKYGTDYGSVTLGLASRSHFMPKIWQFLVSTCRSGNQKHN